MALLGTSSRISYTAKNYRSGLTDVVARAIKPNGSIIGTFSLVEVGNPFFAGIYYFDLLTSESDPVGDWIVLVLSPSENNYRYVVKVTYDPSVNVQAASFAFAVWNTLTSCGETLGSFIQNKSLTVAKFLGMR